MRTLIAIAITAALLGGCAMTMVSQVSASPGAQRTYGRRVLGAAVHRAKRPDRADWEKIKAAAGLRHLGLSRHRSARFRAFAGYLGLSELLTIHPLAAGRCATAVIYLYNNLLDLENAQPGENWAPLRRLVAKEPSIRACAPRVRRER
jgi:hypothetical protein